METKKRNMDYCRTPEYRKKMSDSKKGITTRKGYKLTEEHKNKLRLSVYGDKNYHWKGYNNLKVSTLHRRIEMILGKPNYCEHCKRSDKKHYQWSNKDHKYNFKLTDWQRLCISCHCKYDIKFNNKKYFNN